MRKGLAKQVALAAAFALAGLSPLAAPAQAQGVDFSGERIELTVPFSEGGGADTYARFMAPHLERHLPGEPTIVVRNVPGGGSITGANGFQRDASPDGLDIIALSTSTITAYLLGDELVEFQLEDWIPVTLSASGIIVYASPSTGVAGDDILADVEALKEADLVFGGKQATASELGTLLSLDLLGIDVKPVFGVERGDARMALLRGEFNINYDSSTAYLEQVVPMIEDDEAVPLFTLGFVNESGEVVRDPTFPDLPSLPEVYEMVHGKALSGPAMEAYLSIVSVNVMASKAIALPGGTPQEIVDTYYTAAEEMLDDPEYQALAAEFVGDYPQVVGQTAGDIVKAASSMSDEARTWLREWLKTKYDVEII